MESALEKLARQVACRAVQQTMQAAALAMERTLRKMQKAAAKAGETFLVDSHPAFFFSTILHSEDMVGSRGAGRSPWLSPVSQRRQSSAKVPETAIVTRLGDARSDDWAALDAREFVYANASFGVARLGDDDDYAMDLLREPPEITNHRAAASLLSAYSRGDDDKKKTRGDDNMLLEVRWTSEKDGEARCTVSALDAEGLRPEDARALIDQLKTTTTAAAKKNSLPEDHRSKSPMKDLVLNKARRSSEGPSTIVLLQRWVRPRSKRDHFIRIVWEPQGPLVALRTPIIFGHQREHRRELNVFPSSLDEPITTPWLRETIEDTCRSLARRIARACGAEPKCLRVVCKLGESNVLYLLWCEECDFLRPESRCFAPVVIKSPRQWTARPIFVRVVDGTQKKKRASSARQRQGDANDDSWKRRTTTTNTSRGLEQETTDAFTTRCERIFGNRFTQPKDIAALAYSAHVDNSFRQQQRPPFSAKKRPASRGGRRLRRPQQQPDPPREQKKDPTPEKKDVTAPRVSFSPLPAVAAAS